MAKDLVIVESPTKARTISRFLGSRYIVKASLGHVRDLPKSQIGVNVESNFVPKYLVPQEKKEVIKDLKAAVKDARSVFLATDPDREGEAISWHLAEAIGVDPLKARRVVFHEITRDAINEAFRQPRVIDMQLVNAQQTRRILDRLVGYEISPLLWRSVKGRLSAGRVQSVAVRLIADREREIQAFVPVEYWTIDANLAKQGARKTDKASRLKAGLISIWGKRERIEIPNGEQADTLVADLKPALYTVGDVRTREVFRQPTAPFTTSTLQQEASRKLRFTAKKTMMVAQQLYEGIQIDKEGTVGLITYMRTDSTNVSASAQEEARTFITKKYGADFVPSTPRNFTKKAKNAQEAHEAIRPTSVLREPETIKESLTGEQFRLYDLIWKRFIASQMEAAVLDTTAIDVRAGNTPSKTEYTLRANGSVIRFPGFLVVYREGRDDDEADDDGRQPLPQVTVGEVLDLETILPEQHFTQPPPRYTEATLVKALEEQGIGRPSTYAPILSTIQERGYVRRVDRRLEPTELGFTVNDLLVQHFPDIVDPHFTANMEERLDDIASGEREWVPVLRDFYAPFHDRVEEASNAMPKVKVADEPFGEDCEKCGRPLVIKIGRFGKFIACSGFPECRNTRRIEEKTGVQCPECRQGDIVVRKSRKTNRPFYGCSRYPECGFTVWDKPVPEPCSRCGWIQVETNKGVLCPRCDADQFAPTRFGNREAAAASTNGAKKAPATKATTKKAAPKKTGTTKRTPATTGTSRTT